MVIEDFIIGKYYRYIDSFYVYYFKLKEVEGNKLCVDGWTIWCNTYLEYSKTHILYNNTKNIKEVDLSEIIGYFPQHHPERILYRKKRINSLMKM